MEIKKIRFMKHFVTDGTTKARVHYSAGTYTDGSIGVTLYAKSFEDGKALAEILPDSYKNDTDMMTDYFEKGRVRINSNDSLYGAALARAQAVR